MSNLKKKLDYLKKGKIKKRWERIESREGLSTKEKLDKLVKLSLKRKDKHKEVEKVITEESREDSTFVLRDFSYPLNTGYGKVELADWEKVQPRQLAVLFGEEEFLHLSPMKLLFFDTETTGLSGGTGTIPFLLGFGFFEKDYFKVKIFILNDLSQEEEFLDEVDRFIESIDYSGVVTYNGKSFDYPLMETRYILYRKRFQLLKMPHLDFLYPARTLWKNTYESRKLGYLGDILLGISRSEDIESSQVPMLYFNYLRSNSFASIEKVVEHNALDLVGLSALVLLGVKYVEDTSFTDDEGELLGAAVLYEKYGDIKKANELYGFIKKSAGRADVISQAVKRKAIIVKKKKLYDEAKELWNILSNNQDRYAVRELSVHFEHREKNYFKALEFVHQGLAAADLTDAQREDFEKRLARLNKKIKALEPE
jgi:uncharacterized protein YprB with RNaseH-like and TPR domain